MPPTDLRSTLVVRPLFWSMTDVMMSVTDLGLE